MKPIYKTALAYGMALAVLTTLLKAVEYQYWARDLSVEFYIGLVAVFFTGLGIWAGLKLTQKKVVTVAVGPAFVLNTHELQRLGISKREHEVLALMAKGLSNQEIADTLFVSLNTVKTHTSHLFMKLDVSRRTQAIQRGKELRLIA